MRKLLTHPLMIITFLVLVSTKTLPQVQSNTYSPQTAEAGSVESIAKYTTEARFLRLASGTNPHCTEIKFHNLSRYKGQGWSRVFNDREVAPALRALLKGDLGKLKESLKEVTYPEDSLSYLDKNGVLTLEGGVPGLYTIMEAKLIIEPCGNLYAAVLDNGERFLYFTNDRKQADKLPPALDQWRVKIEKSRNESRTVEALPLVIKNR